jgi:ABC-type bacteriocin/lantibiotic exporter with double-glycine peptidase domain
MPTYCLLIWIHQDEPDPFSVLFFGAKLVIREGLSVGELVAFNMQTLQENILFNHSVRDNIALADPAMPIQQARNELGRRLAPW